MPRSQSNFLAGGKRYRNRFRSLSNYFGGGGLSPYQQLLIADWEFNEPSGARSDSGPNGYTLADNNTVGSGPGVAANDAVAAVFVAANSEYLSRTAGTSPAIEGRTTNFSIEIAFRINAGIGTTQTLFAKGATANNIAGFWFQLQTTGRIQMTLGDGTTRVSVNPTNVLTTATTYHVIVTFDRTGNMVMYINNVAGTGTSSVSIAAIPGNLGNTSLLLVGGLNSSTFSSTDIGFVRIWNKVLDSTERSYLYNSGALRSYAQL